MTTAPQDVQPAAPAPLQIAINVQYIKDLSFEAPNAPQIFGPLKEPPALNMSVNIQTRGLGNNAYEVLLLLKLESTHEGTPAFIAELSYGGVLGVPPVPEEQLKYILLVEGPRLLFPFARGILASTIAAGGFPQLLINPIDFLALYQANAAQLNQPAAGNA